MKLDKKYTGLLLAFFMTTFLDTAMTFTMTSIKTGWTDAFLNMFFQSWIIGFIVALPTSILTIPLARRLTSLLVSEKT